MIEINNLHKTYTVGNEKVQALKGINLKIQKGEIFGIIGFSGAGKSSLVRCINFLEKPDSGEIIVDNVDLTKIPKNELRMNRKKIGMVFQHFNLLNNLTIFDNIAFPMMLSKKPKDYIKEKTNELLELVGLYDKKDSYPSMLSGGQKQRVGIARAIACEPNLIMCDEATSALDPSTTKEILKLLKMINQKLKITIIIITHEMEVIRQICDKVAILDKGIVAEQGNVVDICVEPKTSIAKAFFQAVDTQLDNSIYKKAVEGSGKTIKAIFLGETSTDPYISNMIKEFDVSVSILLGNIQHIQNNLVGTLVIKIQGSDENIQRSINYLEDNNILVEVI